jgi:hypothetical protein
VDLKGNTNSPFLFSKKGIYKKKRRAHIDGTVRKTKAEALAKPEGFDGKTTE